MVKTFVRCGICDIDFDSTEAWDEHVKGERHQKLVAMWRVLEFEARARNDHFMAKEEIIKARKIVDEEHITVEQMQQRLHEALSKIADRKEGRDTWGQKE